MGVHSHRITKNSISQTNLPSTKTGYIGLSTLSHVVSVTATEMLLSSKFISSTEKFNTVSSLLGFVTEYFTRSFHCPSSLDRCPDGPMVTTASSTNFTCTDIGRVENVLLLNNNASFLTMHLHPYQISNNIETGIREKVTLKTKNFGQFKFRTCMLKHLQITSHHVK